MKLRLSAVTLLTGVVLAAQTPEALVRQLEGRQVLVKVDMPADSDGIDVWPLREPSVEFSRHGDRLRRYGLSVPNGKVALITRVRVKEKLIEFHLDGGGYTGGVNTTYINTSVPKTQREKDLEEAIDKEKDPERKKEMRSRLRDMQNARRREESRLEAEAAQAKALADALEREMRASGGSRFNLRFDGRVPAEYLDPDNFLAALAPYVEAPGRGAFSPAPAGAAARAFPIHRGMRESEVRDLFGEPKDRRTEQAAGLVVLTCVYELDEATLTARYVDGLLVKYTLESR